MPYPRRRSYRRRSRKSTPWYARKYSTQQLAYKAFKSAKYLKSLINVEKKKRDTTNTFTSTDQVSLLNQIAQGDTDLTRSGNSILMKSLYLQALLTSNATDNDISYRILIVQDTQQVADTSPSVSDVLDATAANNLIAPLNNETVGRFKVLFDKRGVLNNLVASVTKQRMIKHYFKLNLHARYNGSSDTDIQKNGLYLIWLHNGGANSPTFNVNTRLSFIDN